jgi:hypothetical protein
MRYDWTEHAMYGASKGDYVRYDDYAALGAA